MLRVVAIYAVTAWLILQIGEVVLDPLGFPSWSLRVLVLAAIAGFPLSFVLAWIIDIRPEGLIFDLPLWAGDEEQPRAQRKSDLFVALLAVGLVAGGTYWLLARTLPSLLDDTATTTEEVPPKSIAVLAFENFGALEETNYFAAGLAEEILGLLDSIEELQVVARTSSFQFRNKSLDARDIASRLGVRHLLEGSARQDGKRIRVVARLVNGDDGFRSWTSTYERSLDDVFAIQQEIAAAVVSELKIVLSVEGAQRLKSNPTDSIDAYVFYLEGRGRLRSSLDADVMRAARQLFLQALDIDPAFSRALAGLCEAQLRLYEISLSNEDFEQAADACERADDEANAPNADVSIALGRLFVFRGKHEEAEHEFKRALSTNPEAVDAYIELGELNAELKNKDQAEAYLLRAIDLQRDYWRAYQALARFYNRSGRHDEAVQIYERASGLAPDVAAVYSAMGGAYWMKGDIDSAWAAYEKSLDLKPSRQGYTNFGMRLYYAGDFEAAVRMQREAIALAPEDHRVWGRLAESLRFVDGGASESADAYEAAARFAEGALEVNPEDWKTVGLLGLYQAHLGQAEEALARTRRAVMMSGRKPEALYFEALARLQLGDAEGAIDLLNEAVETNPNYAQFMRTDPDLQQLVGRASFDRLLDLPVGTEVSP